MPLFFTKRSRAHVRALARHKRAGARTWARFICPEIPDSSITKQVVSQLPLRTMNISLRTLPG